MGGKCNGGIHGGAGEARGARTSERTQGGGCLWRNRSRRYGVDGNNQNRLSGRSERLSQRFTHRALEPDAVLGVSFNREILGLVGLGVKDRSLNVGELAQIHVNGPADIGAVGGDGVDRGFS